MDRSKAASPWILDAPRDLLLFVGTPLIILPLVHLLNLRWSSEAIFLVVASFGALGHHLPGMMRAYGDRALFRRFRVRFLVAPVVLAALCVGFALVELSVVLLVVFLWGIWHGLMQIHGFLRIYDSKRGSFSRATAWLDQTACLTWFTAAIAFSDSRVHFFLGHWYSAGGAFVSPETIAALRLGLGWATALVSAAYLAHALRCWRAGTPQSPVKHLLLLTSIAFFWHANVFVADLLIAVVLFEIFHDVQYLSLVWLFNTKRAESDPGVGGFTRFLFRRNPMLIALYLGLIFLYGSMNIANERLLQGTSFQIMAGLLAASALLHFYYDGFIWKVREKDTRSALGLEGGEAQGARIGLGLPGWARHGLKWGLLVVPLAGFGLSLARGGPDEDQVRLLLSASLPGDEEAARNRAIVHYKQGRLDEAARAYRDALAATPPEAASRRQLEADLGATYFQLALEELSEGELGQGRLESATARLREARLLSPDLASAAFDAGLAAGQRGEHALEEAHYRAVLILDPGHGRAAFNLAVTLAQAGRRSEALEWTERAAELLPGDERPAQLRRTLSASP